MKRFSIINKKKYPFNVSYKKKSTRLIFTYYISIILLTYIYEIIKKTIISIVLPAISLRR